MIKEKIQTKIIIITAFFPPEKGAAPYRIFNTAKELKSYGFDVDVITTLANYPMGKFFKGYKWKLFKNENIGGIQCRRYWFIPSNSNNSFVRVLSMFSYCLSLLFTIPFLLFKNPDIILVQTPPLLPGLTASFISKLIRAKLILNVSDIWPLTAVELGVMKRDSLSFRVFSFFENTMYKLSDAMIAQSNQTHEYLKQKSDVSILLYRNLTKPNCQKLIDKKDFMAKKRIIYAGLLGFAQGVFNICKNIDFKNLDVEFHIYGDGVERVLIEKYIYHNPECNVFIHQTVTKDEIQEILMSFDATVIPLTTNIHGAFPSKISMAMSAGLPIFFSGDGEGFSFVDKFNLGYVSEAGNLNSLQKNIKEFSKLDNEQVKLMKQNIINVVNRNFNYADLQLKLCEFISSQIK
jgi:glycosyltransferase involved in cell wall biosynthesis